MAQGKGAGSDPWVLATVLGLRLALMQPLANGLWPACCEVGARGFGTSLACIEPLAEDLRGLWTGSSRRTMSPAPAMSPGSAMCLHQ